MPHSIEHMSYPFSARIIDRVVSMLIPSPVHVVFVAIPAPLQR